jgi:hypothetical protein
MSLPFTTPNTQYYLQAGCRLAYGKASAKRNDRPNLRHLDHHACHCMSLPFTTPNTQYYLQAGCRLAYAMASLQNNLKIKESHLIATMKGFILPQFTGRLGKP